MGRKRRQRSTAIRKRVEKKLREEAKAKKKQAKQSRGESDGGLMRTTMPRAAASATVDSLTELEKRLSEGPIRGWSTDDMEEKWGLSWLKALLDESLDGGGGGILEVELPEAAKDHLSDRLDALDLAAPGLNVDWERGLSAVAQAIGNAELIVEEDDEEDEEEDA